MYWNTIDGNRQKLLKKITERISLNNYYMIGGTALSLQLGLRLSYDFDFCVPEMFNNEVLLEELKEIGKIEIKQNQRGTCDVILDRVQVSFFYYPNKMIEQYVTNEEIPNLKMASIIDIAIMKIVAIGGRGARKDFFDLYNIINQLDIKTLDLAKGLIKKCGNDINYASVIMGLSYFEDAEQEILPETFVEYDWDEIKNFFINFQKEFQDEMNKLVD